MSADSIDEPLARRVRPGDWDRLADFSCSAGAWYEDEVERFVRTRLRGHVERRAPHLETSIVILADADDPEEIVAIGAHELDDQQTEDGRHVEGTYLIVGAVRRDLQGMAVNIELFADGRAVTLGRLLAETMIDDLPQRSGLVRAVMTRENVRSLKLCDRVGLTHEQPDSDERFVQRLGRLAGRSGARCR